MLHFPLHWRWPLPSFAREQIKTFLDHYGYTTNPGPLIQFPSTHYEVNDDLAYLDISADALRRGDEAPDRPIRMTFQKIFDGPEFHWNLISVKELAPGVESKAQDRRPETPKISPWPDLNLDVGKPCPRGCGGKLQEVVGGVVRCDSCGEQYRFRGKPLDFPEPPGRR
jgi:hypothetical protein